MVEVQGKGHSYEVHIPESFEEAVTIMEACRLKAKTVAMASEQQLLDEATNAHDSLDKFEPMKESIIATETAKDKQQKHKALDMDLQEEDWKAFLSGAKQRTYKKGEYVLQVVMPLLLPLPPAPTRPLASSAPHN